MQEQNARRSDREERARSNRQGDRAEEEKWDEATGRGEEFGESGERERAQGDVYGQEQQRSAGPRGEREREEPPHGWYGKQRPPTPENFPRGGASRASHEGGGQRGEEYQGTQGGYEQGHRGGYEKGYRGSQSGYQQDYEQLRPGQHEGPRGQSFGGPGYQEESRREAGGREARGEGWQGRGGASLTSGDRPQGRGNRGRGPKNYVRSDERIAEEVSDLLMESDDVDPSEVEVHVEHGEVILRGTAHSKEEKRRIEDIAGGVLGVQEVLNHLRIRRG